MPLYRGISPLCTAGILSCVWISNLTRSIGAETVFASAPANPPAKKSNQKEDDLVAEAASTTVAEVTDDAETPAE